MTKSFFENFKGSIILFNKLSSARERSGLVKLFILSLFTACTESLSLALIIPLISQFSHLSQNLHQNTSSTSPASFSLIDSSTIALYTTFFFLFLLLSTCLRYVQIKFLQDYCSRLGNSFSLHVISKFFAHEKSHNTWKSYSEFNTSLTSVTSGAATYYEILFGLTTSSIVSLSIILFLLIINTKTTILLFLFLMCVTLPTYKYISNIVNNISVNWPKLNTQKTELVKEIYASYREIILNRTEGKFIAIFLSLDKTLRNSTSKYIFLSASPRFILEISCLTALFLIVIFGLSSSLSLSYIITTLLVYLVAAQKIIPLISQIYNSVLKLGGQYIWVERLISLLLVNDLFTHPIEYPGLSLQSINIRFNNPKSSDTARVIDTTSFDIPINQNTVIIGKSGSGKSTLLDSLIGFKTVDYIEVKINNLRSNLIQSGYKGSIAYVPQQIVCLNTSLEENILFGKQYDKDRLQLCCSIALIDSTFCSSSNFLEYHIGDNGNKLSGGQRQRIAIARGLYTHSSLLILDEPTSSIDRESSLQIIKNIIDYYKGTLILVTHDYYLEHYFQNKIEIS